MRKQTSKFLKKLQKAKNLPNDNDLKRFWRAMSHKQRGAFRCAVQPVLERIGEESHD